MKKLLTIVFLTIGISAAAQRLGVGITLQYFPFKQVTLNAADIVPNYSYSVYKAGNNNWKLWSAGQSFVVGGVFQLNRQRFYFTAEPSLELNTYNYSMTYQTGPGVGEKIVFQVLYLQALCPIIAGYQFHSSGVFRYSFYAGVSPSTSFHIEARFTQNADQTQYDRYTPYDMNGILYSGKPWWNGIAGFGIHVASIAKIEIRYLQRLDSPGDQYKATFSSFGVGLTYYFPIKLLKKTIYRED
ncbi:MAG: hypothetical protein JST14_02005 [Bacteroidetes bacterium]|nr:hypothetical protein [Bacteroidota bacterium]